MLNSSFDVPIVLMVFNRPQLTAQVFSVIKQLRPKQLFLIADGPRSTVPSDAPKCADTRKILENIDWDCQVYKNYSDNNLGCGWRPFSGITWVFEHVDQAIILEDDCFPDVTFFDFCKELLEKYHAQEEVMQISGSQMLNKLPSRKTSYYFSKYSSGWGWATWKRAWEKCDYHLNDFPKALEEDWFNHFFKNPKIASHWTNTMRSVYEKEKNHIWDYQWEFACWRNDGLSIRPTRNLINNIGFMQDATHTKDSGYKPDVTFQDMLFPLVHPQVLSFNLSNDRKYEQKILELSSSNFLPKLKRKVFRLRQKMMMQYPLRRVPSLTEVRDI